MRSPLPAGNLLQAASAMSMSLFIISFALVSFGGTASSIALQDETDSSHHICLLQMVADKKKKKKKLRNKHGFYSFQEVRGRHRSLNTTKKSPCQPKGQLFFAHVMKDGGESVDNYLDCLCEEQTCSIMHREGPAKYKTGVKRCDATVCTSHGITEDRSSDCGDSFENASLFTVMRRPSDRVASLFYYYKYTRNESWYENRSLMDVLQVVKGCAESLEGAHCGGSSEYTNAMVDRYFGNSMTSALARGENGYFADSMTLGLRRDSAYSAKLQAKLSGRANLVTDTDLTQAKARLAAFDAIFFMDDFDHFAKLYKASSLPLSAAPSACRIRKVNHAKKGSHHVPSAEEEELLEKLNWADIELYNYAKTLPRRM